MVLGAYFLTYCEHDLQSMSSQQAAKAIGVKGLKRYRTEEEVELAIEDKVVDYHTPIEYLWSGELYVTTPGRVIFNVEVERALDEATGGDFEDHDYLNKTLTKRELDTFIGELVEHYGPNTIAAALDVITSVTFRFATRAGITISKNDIVPPGALTVVAPIAEPLPATAGALTLAVRIPASWRIWLKDPRAPELAIM